MPTEVHASTCRFDAPAVLAAIDQLAGMVESLRAGLAGIDQKVTQLRTIEHQALLQTVKQLRGAMDMATRDHKRQLDLLTANVLAATTRIQSLDLAMSNQKLHQLAARAAQAQTVGSPGDAEASRTGGGTGASDDATR